MTAGRAAAALALGMLLAGAAVAAPEPAPCKRFEARLQKIDTPAPRADDRGVDILSYDLELKLDPAPGPAAGVVALTGRVAIGLVALRAAVDTLVLDLVPELTCDGVTRSGQALAFSRAGEELHVAVPGGLAVAAPETLTIAWHGRPPRHGNLYVGLMYRSDDAGTPGDPADDIPMIFTVSEPWSAHAWWPCKDHPADKAQVSLAATVPADLSAVGNGTLESVTDAEPGWRRFAWRERYPLPTYLVSVAASRYAPWNENCAPVSGDPVPLEFHALERDVPAARELFADTCAMMDLLTDRLGPYPFAGEKYAQVEVIWGGAMEHTTATSLGQFMLTGDRRYENVVIHELAHQWFGDSLTPARWADIWLNEGFATYAEALWIERTLGPQAYHDFLRLIGPGRHPDRFAGQGTLSDPSPVLPNTLVYDKGAWVLHMLRGFIGDEAFFRFLRQYAGDPELAQGSVTGEAMIARAEAASGRALGGFFAPWLTTDEVPVLSLEAVAPPTTATGRLTVRLRQHQSLLMATPVPLEIRTGSRRLQVTALLEARTQDFTWDLAGAADSVAPDPNRPTLARWLDAPPAPLAVRGPAPNPVTTAGADFTLFLVTESQLLVNIYDARGALLASLDAGTIPATVAGDNLEPVGTLWHWAPEVLPAPLPSGAYWFEFRAGSHRQVRPLIWVR